MLNVIKKPLITEKNTRLSETGVYVFEVAKQATKIEIKKAVEKSFRVKVASVNTAVCSKPGRRIRTGYGQPQQWKKAMVKLQPGEKIGLFEGA